MAIITLNNNSLSGVTALPAGVVDANALASGVGGKVLQVVSTSTTTETSTNSTSFVLASGLTLNITPSSSTSKILIFGSTCTQANAGAINNLSIFRDSTNLGETNQGFGRLTNADEIVIQGSVHYLDSPATTSQITYALYVRSNGGGGVTVQTNSNGTRGSITAIEIAG